MRTSPARDRAPHGLKPRAPPLSFGPLQAADAADASEMILRCFWRFNADQYGDNTKAFTDSVTPEQIEKFIRSDVVVAAKTQDGDICGIACVTGHEHLELLFVDEKYQRLGVAASLWRLVLERVAPDPHAPVEITVNSSDFAVEFYEAIGFVRVPFERPIVKRLRFQRQPPGP
jgi:ribosomal protein S18 acetylase RimI-like enzyme